MGLSIDEARRALVDIARSMSRQKEDAVRRNERMRGKPLSYNINILGLGAIGRSVPGLLLEDILLEGYIDRINLMSHSPGKLASIIDAQRNAYPRAKEKVRAIPYEHEDQLLPYIGFPAITIICTRYQGQGESLAPLLTAASRRGISKERLAPLQANYEGVLRLGKTFASHADKGPFLVVSNPVDVMAEVLSVIAKNPMSIGCSHNDELRLEYFLSEVLGQEYGHQVHVSLPVIGTHDEYAVGIMEEARCSGMLSSGKEVENVSFEECCNARELWMYAHQRMYEHPHEEYDHVGSTAGDTAPAIVETVRAIILEDRMVRASVDDEGWYGRPGMFSSGDALHEKHLTEYALRDEEREQIEKGRGIERLLVEGMLNGVSPRRRQKRSIIHYFLDENALFVVSDSFAIEEVFRWKKAPHALVEGDGLLYVSIDNQVCSLHEKKAVSLFSFEGPYPINSLLWHEGMVYASCSGAGIARWDGKRSEVVLRAEKSLRGLKGGSKVTCTREREIIDVVSQEIIATGKEELLDYDLGRGVFLGRRFIENGALEQNRLGYERLLSGGDVVVLYGRRAAGIMGEVPLIAPPGASLPTVFIRHGEPFVVMHQQDEYHIESIPFGI